MKKTLASIIRILSIPPLMVLCLLMILYIRLPDIFSSVSDCFILLLLLGIFPILAYPFQKLIPRLKAQGRDGQRKTAFMFSLIGYSAAMIWSTASKANQILITTTMTYFISVFILTIINKVFHFKASGHACSFTAPIIFPVCFIDWRYLIPGVLAALIISWSSLYLKRHTTAQLAAGSITCIISFLLAMLIVY